MKKWKIGGLCVVGLMVPFLIGLYSLGMFKFFAPKTQNIKRQVFENTKSFLHGVQQDLGKYYLEYQTADEEGQNAIKTTIQMRFGEVDADKLQSPDLRNFLITMRGYK